MWHEAWLHQVDVPAFHPDSMPSAQWMHVLHVIHLSPPLLSSSHSPSFSLPLSLPRSLSCSLSLSLSILSLSLSLCPLSLSVPLSVPLSLSVPLRLLSHSLHFLSSIPSLPLTLFPSSPRPPHFSCIISFQDISSASAADACVLEQQMDECMGALRPSPAVESLIKREGLQRIRNATAMFVSVSRRTTMSSRCPYAPLHVCATIALHCIAVGYGHVRQCGPLFSASTSSATGLLDGRPVTFPSLILNDQLPLLSDYTVVPGIHRNARNTQEHRVGIAFKEP